MQMTWMYGAVAPSMPQKKGPEHAFRPQHPQRVMCAQLVLAAGGVAGFTSAAATGFFAAAGSTFAAVAGVAGFTFAGAVVVFGIAALVALGAVAGPCAIAGSDNAVSMATVRKDTRVIGVVSALPGAIA